MAGEETNAYSIQRNFLSLLNENDNIPLSNPFGTGVYGPGHFFLSTKTTSYRSVPPAAPMYHNFGNNSLSLPFPYHSFPTNFRPTRPQPDESIERAGAVEQRPLTPECLKEDSINDEDFPSSAGCEHEYDDSFGGSQPATPKETANTESVDAFTDGMVRYLLDIYKTRYNKLAGARNNKDKARWWEQLTEDFNNKFSCAFSKERLRTKINHLKQKLKKVEGQSNVSGAGRTNIKMRDDLLEAFGGSPSVEGPKTVSLAGIEGNADQQDGPNSDKNAGNRKRTYRSAADKVFAILERSEELAEERENEREKRRK